MPLRGDIARIKDLKRKIADMPTTMAVDVAGRAAPELTGLTRGSFEAGQSVYGDPRPIGVDGKPLTLVDSGKTKEELQFTSDGGTVVRAKLGTRWAKYLIGKYGILPNSNSAVPAEWSRKLQELVKKTRGLLP